MKAPNEYNGRKLCYDTVFRSRPYETQKEALWKLDFVREFYSLDRGWVEIDANVEETLAGGYVAVRHHALYK